MGNSSGEEGEGARGCSVGRGSRREGGRGRYGKGGGGEDRQTETWTRGQTMKKTSNVEEDCGGEQVKSMAAGFM